MVKLYKRSEDQTHYWEAWEDNGKIIFHWGVLGERGKTRTRRISFLKPAQRIIDEETKKRRFEGYHEIPINKHTLLIVQYQTESWGAQEDLQKRHTVEDLLDECLGWTGNGHCDGGDIGSGTINAFSYVIDPFLAVGTIVESLRRSGLLPGAVIAIANEEGFDVLWPQDYKGSFSYFPPAEKAANTKDLTEENVATIATLLQRIQEEGGTGNFVVFIADAEANYYIQFAGEASEPELYAEAVSNEFLEPKFKLNQDQISALQALGWSAPSSDRVNFYRDWHATNHEHRVHIAREVMRTFSEIYGIAPDQPLSVNLGLQ